MCPTIQGGPTQAKELKVSGCDDYDPLTFTRRVTPNSKGDHDHFDCDRSNALRLRRFKESFTSITYRL